MNTETSRKPQPVLSRSFEDDRADAVRYAVLQRIAPSLRHDMVVHLQPIGMVYELMEHRVANQGRDMASVHDSAAKMSRFARAALSSCSDTATWLERDPRVMTSMAEGACECIAILGRTFGFMGFKLVNEVQDKDSRVPRDAFRHTLTSALLAAADTAAGPADVIVRSATGADEITLSLAVVAQTGKRVHQPFEEAYRRLNWDDVRVIAQTEHVGFTRQADGATLAFRI